MITTTQNKQIKQIIKLKKSARRKLSAALTISHASADGYHASMFFERLQEVLDEFVIDQ